MQILKEMTLIFEKSPTFVKCTNYYFQNHQCEIGKKNIKIMMDYTFMENKSGEKLVFGYCDKCNKVFYNFDYE